MKYILTRDVTTKECHWLERDYKKGETVFEYHGYTYGCMSPNGSPFTMVDGETPFFELPNNSVEPIKEIIEGGIQEGHIFPTEDDIYLK